MTNNNIGTATVSDAPSVGLTDAQRQTIQAAADTAHRILCAGGDYGDELSEPGLRRELNDSRDALRALLARQPAAIDKDADDDIEEAREILENMVRSIELDGNYSTEATCTFLRQALNCLPVAPPLANEASKPAPSATCSVSEDCKWPNCRRDCVIKTDPAPSVEQDERGAFIKAVQSLAFLCRTETKRLDREKLAALDAVEDHLVSMRASIRDGDGELRAASTSANVAQGAEIERLKAIINSPESDDFLKGVSIVAEYQRQLHGIDDGETRFDWAQYFWVAGYLLNKALAACKSGEGNGEKAKHHLVTSAALIANWHNVLTGKPAASVHSNDGQVVADRIVAASGGGE